MPTQQRKGFRELHGWESLPRATVRPCLVEENHVRRGLAWRGGRPPKFALDEPRAQGTMNGHYSFVSILMEPVSGLKQKGAIRQHRDRRESTRITQRVDASEMVHNIVGGDREPRISPEPLTPVWCITRWNTHWPAKIALKFSTPAGMRVREVPEHHIIATARPADCSQQARMLISRRIRINQHGLVDLVNKFHIIRQFLTKGSREPDYRIGDLTISGELSDLDIDRFRPFDEVTLQPWQGFFHVGVIQHIESTQRRDGYRAPQPVPRRIGILSRAREKPSTETRSPCRSLPSSPSIEALETPSVSQSNAAAGKPSRFSS